MKVQIELPPINPAHTAVRLMEKHSVDAIVGALNMANVRYLVAGGLASWPTVTCVAATFIGLHDLRRLKQRAGRPQDLLDLEKLKSLDTGTPDE